jgi:hypothetical protein
MKRLVVVATSSLLCIGLAACSKNEGVAEVNKGGKYAGKPDTRPWESEKTAFTDTKLTKGDKAAWESALKARAQAQNEFAKTQ